MGVWTIATGLGSLRVASQRSRRDNRLPCQRRTGAGRWMVLRWTSLTQHRPQAFDRVRGCRHDLSETPTVAPYEERQVQPLAPVGVANLRMTESPNAVERARLVRQVPPEGGQTRRGSPTP